MTVKQANQILDADFSVFTHSESGKQYVRTMQYSIPPALDGHIQLITPTTSFPAFARKARVISVSSSVVPKALSSDATPPASCNSMITPSCLQTLYNIPTAAATIKASALGVTGFDEQFANTQDLSNFLKRFRIDIPSTTSFNLLTVDGGQNIQTLPSAGVDANLNIEYTVGLATGIPVTFISVGESNTDGLLGFLDVMQHLLAESAPPQVVTTSYLFSETDLTRAIATSLCNTYMQMSARGVSIIFSAGDGGVSGGEVCTTFIPTFPGGCPFVTVVGATQNVPEQAATFSAGGFSNYFAAPSYQTTAVQTYLARLGTLFLGRQYRNFLGGQLGAVSGTEASAPIFASVIALLNAELISAGKPPLGFLNPWLYANPGAFNDITVGSNPGCSTKGFPAMSGWDPVTGLGTPNYALMRMAAGVSDPSCTC
ncbi:peptidase S8/S53 domain-containing protein [Mycena sp. CBHHK59/15]|nr:peptidase S8/S53 domain-containing protein [Mycena sp. CBHHK59/15]